jgi:hypothetical protein
MLRFFNYLLIGLSLIFIVSACSQEQYSFQKSTYPENIQAHESGWMYMVTTVVTTRTSRSMLRIGEKQVEIRIEDNEGKLIFLNSEDYVAAGVSSKVIWSNFPNVTILIYEYGTDKLDDEYSNNLAGEGKKLISEHHITLP